MSYFAGAFGPGRILPSFPFDISSIPGTMLQPQETLPARAPQGPGIMDRYADGTYISPRRRQKALILEELLDELLPDRENLELVDFGCADGAIPVLLLRSSLGPHIARITGITRLDYNDLEEKPCHEHPRFVRIVGDLDEPLHGESLPWGRCDAVLGTAFFHYLRHPRNAFELAAALLKAEGFLIAGMPAPWLLRLRRRGLGPWLPKNNRIAGIHSLDFWRELAGSAGLVEVRRNAAQWFGLECTAGIEAACRKTGMFSFLASNHFVVYRKD